MYGRLNYCPCSTYLFDRLWFSSFFVVTVYSFQRCHHTASSTALWPCLSQNVNIYFILYTNCLFVRYFQCLSPRIPFVKSQIHFGEKILSLEKRTGVFYKIPRHSKAFTIALHGPFTYWGFFYFTLFHCWVVSACCYLRFIPSTI